MAIEGNPQSSEARKAAGEQHVGQTSSLPSAPKSEMLGAGDVPLNPTATLVPMSEGAVIELFNQASQPKQEGK